MVGDCQETMDWLKMLTHIDHNSPLILLLIRVFLSGRIQLPRHRYIVLLTCIRYRNYSKFISATFGTNIHNFYEV